MNDRSILPENITLILGAGVSNPYGFPLGAQLVQRIVDIDATVFERKTKDPRFSASIVKKFQTDLRNSGRRSIDRFLQHRPEYSDLGKTLIAFTLMRLERPDALYAGDSKGGIYSYLYNNILDPTVPDKLNAKRFVIITYNYDRSLEFFLWNALRHGFRLDDDEAANYMATLPIYHVHGSFGAVSGSDRRDYASNLIGLGEVPDRLRIVSEDIEQSQVIRDCRRQIAMSRTIVFLGFGYDRVNVERLRIPKIMEERASDAGPSAIFGTTHGFTEREVDVNIRPLFQSIVPTLSTLICLEFLRHAGLWQRAHR